MRETEGSGPAHRDSDQPHPHTLKNDRISHIARLGAQGEPHSQFLRTLLHKVRHQSIYADRGQKECRAAKDGRSILNSRPAVDWASVSSMERTLDTGRPPLAWI